MGKVASVPGLIDLHLHLDGSISPAIARRLAEIGNQELPASEEELVSRLRVSPDCRDLNEYLARFDFPLSLLQTQEQISESVLLLQEELAEMGLLYAEIRFAPQSMTAGGLTQEEAIDAALDGLSRSSFHAGLILCAMRGEGNGDANEETFRLAARRLGKGVCGVDLAGAEAIWPTSSYEGLFAQARELGIPFTVHAGEAAGADSVATALDFGAKRLGHGVRCLEDPHVAERVAASGTTLEVCPTSNIQTCVYPDYASCPLKKLTRAGIAVCLNSDNMAVSGTDVQREHALVGEALGMGLDDHLALELASVRAAFLPDEKKAELERQVRDAYAAMS